MENGKNGRQIGAEYAEWFNNWVTERDSVGDWSDYVRAGKLNRTEIAAECRFDRGILQTNPVIKTALAALEMRLSGKGVMSPKSDLRASPKASSPLDEASVQAIERRLAVSKSRDDRRIKSLEEQNAVLAAEVSRLKEQVRQYKLIDEHLAETGRMIRL